MLFNKDDVHVPDDMTIICGEAQSEREKNKVIQAPQNNAKDLNQTSWTP